MDKLAVTCSTVCPRSEVMSGQTVLLVAWCLTSEVISAQTGCVICSMMSDK